MQHNSQQYVYTPRSLNADPAAVQFVTDSYQICKANYEQAADKKQAIYDMFHIQDYKAFLQKSKWEEKVAAL
jgi:hypothetical protein